MAIKDFQDEGLQLVLRGHIHIQDIKLNNSGSRPIYDIATSALSVYSEQYVVIKYSSQAGFDYTTFQVDVEGFAKSLKLKDINLVNFKQYSKNSFETSVYKSTSEIFSGVFGACEELL